MRRSTVALVAALAFVSVRAADIDGDGYPDGTDCNDRDERVWSLPGEPQNLHFTSRTTFVWDALVDLGGSSGDTYVTLRSTSPSNFASAPAASCNDTEGLSTSTTDTTVPPPGSAFFYLVRARNACGDGVLGHRSNGAPVAGLACDCAVLCDDGLACTRARCSDGACVHDAISAGIDAPPDDVAVCPGGSATFRVRGIPDGSTLHYQWKKDGANVGIDSPALTLAGLAPADNNAKITVVVTGACAPVTSPPAIVTVFPSTASCSGGGNGYEAPNRAGDDVALGNPDAPGGDEGRDYGSVHLATGEFHIEDVDLVIRG